MSTLVSTPLNIAATINTSGTLAAGKHTPVDATSGALTVNLPTTPAVGAHLSVEKLDGSANAVTISGSIRGATATIPLVFKNETVELVADGSGSWWPIAGHKTKATLDATYVQGVSLRTSVARNPDALVTGAITRDVNGAATSAPVTWPDGTPGTYSALVVSSAFPGAVDSYSITYGSPVTATYTQPTVTRDATTGAAVNVPAITVS